MNISNKMKEIRAITGLTRKDFSDKYGIPLRTLGNGKLDEEFLQNM